MTERNEATDYFNAHVLDQTDDCMIWPYSTYPNGYGKVWVASERRVRQVTILACIAHHGPRPLGMDAAHGPCHNRRCWNGAHLSWKTRKENVADRERDGTHLRGEAIAQAKLTEAAVIAIREQYAAGGVTQSALAAAYGVGQDQISRIVTGKRWGHLGKPA